MGRRSHTPTCGVAVRPLDPIASPCMVAEVLRASLLLGLVGLVLATPVVFVGAAPARPALKDPFASDPSPAPAAPRGELRNPFADQPLDPPPERGEASRGELRDPFADQPLAHPERGAAPRGELLDPFAATDRGATPAPSAQPGLRDPFVQRPASEPPPAPGAQDLRDPWASPRPTHERRAPIQPRTTAGSADLVDPWALPLHR